MDYVENKKAVLRVSPRFLPKITEWEGYDLTWEYV